MDVLAVALPALVVAPLWYIVVLRLLYVRATRAQRILNATALLMAAGATVALPGVRPAIDSVTFHGAGSMLQNSLFLLAGASAYALFSSWWHGPRKYRWVWPAATAVALALAVVMCVVGYQAFRLGVDVREGPDWAFVVYASVFSGPLLIVAVSVLVLAIRGITRVRGRERRSVALLAFLSGAVSLYLVTGLVAGVADYFHTTWPILEPVLESGAVIAILVTAVMFAMIARPLVQRFVRERAAKAGVRSLRPMWRTLTTAVPEVVLPLRRVDRRALSHSDRLHRMSVEIRDAILVLEPGLPAELSDDPAVVAAALRIAARARPTGNGVQHPSAAQSRARALHLSGDLAGLRSVAACWEIAA
ncbi:MAB_1171c family putative transporter [Rhodococcus sp. HNM0569]|uniref:MAB_1171c family putative transporter n=1 Tax=Rhodococcus sp. HNM0569 TaxID=2716340 RepID=UPI00146DE517|nr:MAB_1171c family putative transporter [Rhodococcus sp. HNM0569]NLU83298.1 hypothetical protein [Rhodococcus sp. HNM0569]